MKKTIAVLAAALALTQLAACGSFDDGNHGPNGQHYWHGLCTSNCSLEDGPQLKDWLHGKTSREVGEENARKAEAEREAAHEHEAATATKAPKAKAPAAASATKTSAHRSPVKRTAGAAA
ncbi:hypothetical protein [Paraburkholderia sp. GAS32]|uniref:hypothetical protein n=1 Tax=Paraburkholderia sp. GAS32 TaxID=3035129 RepID=UPI003D245989